MIEYYDPQYYGTETWWKHPLYGFIYTDSIKDFCKEYQAYWVLDVIGSYYPRFKHYSFLLLSFDVVDGKCKFYIQEDTGLKHIIEQKIDFTDLKVSIRLYYENEVICFPSDR